MCLVEIIGINEDVDQKLIRRNMNGLVPDKLGGDGAHSNVMWCAQCKRSRDQTLLWCWHHRDISGLYVPFCTEGCMNLFLMRETVIPPKDERFTHMIPQALDIGICWMVHVHHWVGSTPALYCCQNLFGTYYIASQARTFVGTDGNGLEGMVTRWFFYPATFEECQLLQNGASLGTMVEDSRRMLVVDAMEGHGIRQSWMELGEALAETFGDNVLSV